MAARQDRSDRPTRRAESRRTEPAPLPPTRPGGTPSGRTAVVVGASIAGLLAARVLAERFDTVLLLDRDTVPGRDAGAVQRKSTPHAVHAHGLLAAGRRALEALFPGLGQEWLAQGVPIGDLQGDVAFYAGRCRFAQADCGEPAVAIGRAALEAGVRRRVLALPGVRVIEGVSVQGLMLDADGRRVTGVRVQASGFEQPARLPAQLVVDASGRGSALPRWLAELGFPPPAEERVAVDLHYVTAYLDIDAEHAPRELVVLQAPSPDIPRLAVMLRQENGGRVLTMAGYGRDAPSLDRAAFIARARLSVPEIAYAMTGLRRMTDPVGYTLPHTQRRRYERLRRMPEGVLAIGDAVCAVNPVYGQGMTVAAGQALALRDALGRGLPGLTRRYFARAATVADGAWDTSVASDLALPGLPGARPPAVRALNRYLARLYVMARHDAAVARAFLRVAHLLDAPAALMRPAVLWRVMRPGRPVSPVRAAPAVTVPPPRAVSRTVAGQPTASRPAEPDRKLRA